MRGAKRVVVALGPLGEPGQPAAGPQRADAVAAAGQYFVGVSLMADIPDQAVSRGVEHIVQCGGQLNDAKPRAEMSAGDRNGGYRLLAQLVGDLTNLVYLEPAQIVRSADGVEKRRFSKIGQSDIPILHVG